jgi:hypothetical protein
VPSEAPLPWEDDYWSARCLFAIESVSRTGKPVAEVGEMRCSRDEKSALEEFLRRRVEEFGDRDVNSYVRRTGPNRYAFGFFVFPWVRDAIRFIGSGGRPLRESDRHWIQGLLFGYRPDAIQRFLRGAGSESSESK